VSLTSSLHRNGALSRSPGGFPSFPTTSTATASTMGWAISARCLR
jgi:hypothetical protein